MTDARRGPGSERDPTIESRRSTPAIGIDMAHDAPAMQETANEDFLFHLYRGSELLQDNRVHEAKEELERALDLQPRDAKGQDLLAIVYFRLGHFPRAITIYEQLRRSAPRDPALLLNLALCYLKTGQPTFARRELAELVKHHPTHMRGWGYLGLACERLGDLEEARAAFERGGHVQLVARMEAAIAGRSAASLPPMSLGARPSAEAREAVAAAFEELDAGELSFAIADPAREDAHGPAAAAEWQSVELGQRPSVPQLAMPPSTATRRPTLIAPAPPAAEAGGILPPSQRLVAPPPSSAYAALAAGVGAGRTLPPVLHRQTAPLPAASQLARDSAADFPSQGEVVVHASGVALVRTGDAGFHVRVEAMRAGTTSLTWEAVSRRQRGKASSEPLGGPTSPIALFRGDGQIVIGPRPSRELSSFLLEDETAFVREDVLLGFDGRLEHENGRVADADGELLSMVHLTGSGAVLLEALGPVLTLEVTEGRGLHVRRETVVAWFGRLVPRAVPPQEAPAGQRGLLAFAGEGSVLFATA